MRSIYVIEDQNHGIHEENPDIINIFKYNKLPFKRELGKVIKYDESKSSNESVEDLDNAFMETVGKYLKNKGNG